MASGYTPTPDYYRDYIQHGMTQMSEDDYLEHYGVKGMKWKVRKAVYNYKKKHGKSPKINYDGKFVTGKNRNVKYIFDADAAIPKAHGDDPYDPRWNGGPNVGFRGNKAGNLSDRGYPAASQRKSPTVGGYNINNEPTSDRKTGSVERGIAAGRERAKKRKKS